MFTLVFRISLSLLGAAEGRGLVCSPRMLEAGFSAEGLGLRVQG